MDLFHTPSFGIYAIFATALCLLLMSIDGIGGGVRAGTKTTPNPEDLSTTSKGAALAPLDPDRVARVMRAHRNALANVVPFLIITLLYVALGASAQWTLILCAVFTAARVIHAVVYIKGVQPWRTLAFVVGQACTVIAAVQVIRAALAVA